MEQTIINVNELSSMGDSIGTITSGNIKMNSSNNYKKLINDDAKWLVENTNDSLERQHILKVLWGSIKPGYLDIEEYYEEE